MATRTLIRNLTIGPLLFSCILLAGCQKEPEPKFRVVDPKSPEGVELSKSIPASGDRGPLVSARSRGNTEPEQEMEDLLPPARGRTFHLSAERSEQTGDGSEQNPWRSLQQAVEQLAPGDRLILHRGTHYGPVVLADRGVSEPIELVARLHSVLRNPDETTGPVVQVDGSGWALHGLEIKPGPGSIGVEFSSNVRRALLNGNHIHDGGFEGLLIRGGAEGVSLQRNHVHHVGRTNGGPGILIETGASGITLLDNKVHGVETKIVLFEPGRFEELAMGGEGTRRLELTDEDIRIQEGTWEP